MSYKKLYLNPKKDESLRRRHPWIFSGAIHHAEGSPEEGEIVKVYDAENHFLAVGHCQIGSIAVRILSFEDEEIDLDFWKKRFMQALQLRKQLGFIDHPINNTYRLIHGEGDCMPGLIVDVYAGTAVMQTHTPGMHLVRMELAEALKETLGSQLHNIYYKSEATLPFKAGLDAEDGYLYGGTDVSNIVIENGMKFHVDWVSGQKTGFFIDQRDNRRLLENYAKDRDVLNMFCYTGGFSCFAMRGGAHTVHSVDTSSKVIALTDENVALNFPDDCRHRSFSEDAFKYLEKMGAVYDLIVLDPPAFAKHRNVLRNALQGYKKLNTLAFAKIKQGGLLFTFSCSQVVTKEQFRLTVFSAAAQAKRNVRILHQLTQAADHPINIYHPEGEYIKGLVLYVD
ncbi:MAG: class I SAM-dependent rRNA methyltransferase [Dysgonamonadaceae bacterium]|jgi:23S rRNA (cytosine1962-C5)-methyltransferase|nr:class I SAM-dependent rRNA methyltransferase [Dysgonamonadaceae bacterium]